MMQPFEAWLTDQYSSPQTRKGYAGDVAQFRAWCSREGDSAPEVQELTAVEARAWLAQYSGSTHNRKLAALKAWERWGQELGTLRDAPLARVEYLAVQSGGVKWLDVKERGKVEGWAEKLVSAASTEAARRNAIRNAAMLCVLRYAGLRVSECAALDLADVLLRPRSGEVVVKHGKGNKRRAIPIEHKELIYWLERWLEVRTAVGECPALFTNKRGQRITRAGIGAAVEEIGRVAGVTLTPHTLRHTFGKSLLEASGDRGMVKDLLGHSRLETTLIYTQPGEAEVRAALGRM